MTHLDQDCPDFRTGDKVATLWGEVDCPLCKATAARLRLRRN